MQMLQKHVSMSNRANDTQTSNTWKLIQLSTWYMWVQSGQSNIEFLTNFAVHGGDHFTKSKKTQNQHDELDKLSEL